MNLEAIAIKNLQRATLNLYPDTMSLSERIDCLYSLNESDRELPQLMQIVENELLNTTQSKDYEQYIQSSIYPVGLTAGYQYGISRLILYGVYKKTPDVVRYLFL